MGQVPWGICGCLGNAAKFPKEIWFPIANGLKFLWKTCFFGSLEQMGPKFPQGNMPRKLKPICPKDVLGWCSPSNHISTRNFSPFVFKNHVLSPYFLGNHVSLGNLSPFALEKLWVPISPRSYLGITFLSWRKELNLKPLGWRGWF
jgi:hypothetical protein